MKNLLVRFLREDQGQDLVEYGLLVGFVSLVAATGAALVGVNLNTWYNGLGGTIAGMPVGPVAAP